MSNKEYQKKWREKNKEKIAQDQKEYRERNKEKLAAKRKIYCQKNKAKCAAARDKWRKENPEKFKAYLKKYYKTEKFKAICKRWRQKNRKHLANYSRIRDRKLKGLPLTPKNYSFFSDFLKPFIALPNEQDKNRLIKLIDKSLTDKQSEVFAMTLEGKTQIEIAKLMQVKQCTISHYFRGNEMKGVMQGGIVKKARQIFQTFKTQNEDLSKLISKSMAKTSSLMSKKKVVSKY